MYVCILVFVLIKPVHISGKLPISSALNGKIIHILFQIGTWFRYFIFPYIGVCVSLNIFCFVHFFFFFYFFVWFFRITAHCILYMVCFVTILVKKLYNCAIHLVERLFMVNWGFSAKERNISSFFCSFFIYLRFLSLFLPLTFFFFFPSSCGLTTSSSWARWQQGINPGPSHTCTRSLHPNTRCAHTAHTQYSHTYTCAKI